MSTGLMVLCAVIGDVTFVGYWCYWYYWWRYGYLLICGGFSDSVCLLDDKRISIASGDAEFESMTTTGTINTD